VLIDGGSRSNVLWGNSIRSNGADGVNISGVTTTDNAVGQQLLNSRVSGLANTIADNLGNGVTVNRGLRNSILANSIFANLGTSGAIGLVNGGNASQAAPALATATRAVIGGQQRLAITGTATGTPRQQLVIEFFRNAAGGTQASQFLGRVTVTTNASGSAVIAANLFLPLGTVAAGDSITATATTATTPSGNTSRVSAPVTAA